MRWCKVFHPEISQSAVIPESSVDIHRARGWWRVGEYVDQQDQAVAADGNLRDLDAEPETKPEPEPAPKPAKTTNKES